MSLMAGNLVLRDHTDLAEMREYTRIYAPEDGIIGDKQVQIGNQVAPGQAMFALT